MANKFTISTVFAAIDHMTTPLQKMNASVGKLGESVERMHGKLNDRFGNLAKIGKGAMMGIGVAAAAAGAGIYAMVKHTSDAAASIKDVATSLGIGTDALQEYRYIAKLSGMETADMDTALTKLTVQLGKGDLAKPLATLGLSVEDLQAAGPDKVLELVADAMSKMNDPAEKAAVAVQMFGKSSVRMVNALSDGADGVKKLREEAQKTGYVMNGSTIDAAANLDDIMDRLKLTVDGLISRMGAKFLPLVEKLADGLQKSLQPGGALSDVLDGLVGILEAIGPVIEAILPLLGEIMKSLGPILTKAIKAAMPLITKIIGFVEKLLPPIMEIVDALVDLLGPAFEALMPILEIIMPIVVAIVKGIAILIKGISMVLKPVIEGIGIAFGKLRDFLGTVWNGIVTAASSVWTAIQAGFTAAADVISKVFMTVADVLLTVFGTVVKAVVGAAAEVGKFLGQDVGGLTDLVSNIEKVQATVRAGSAFGPGSAGQPMTAGPVSTVNNNTTSKSTVDVNLGGLPAGSSVKQTGSFQGFNLNLGSGKTR